MDPSERTIVTGLYFSLKNRIEPKEPVEEIKNSNVTLICEQKNGNANSKVSSKYKVHYAILMNDVIFCDKQYHLLADIDRSQMVSGRRAIEACRETPGLLEC